MLILDLLLVEPALISLPQPPGWWDSGMNHHTNLAFLCLDVVCASLWIRDKSVEPENTIC